MVRTAPVIVGAVLLAACSSSSGGGSSSGGSGTPPAGDAGGSCPPGAAICNGFDEGTYPGWDLGNGGTALPPTVVPGEAAGSKALDFSAESGVSFFEHDVPRAATDDHLSITVRYKQRAAVLWSTDLVVSLVKGSGGIGAAVAASNLACIGGTTSSVGAPLDPGTWQTIRLDVVDAPGSRTVHCYLDDVDAGKTVDSAAPPGNDARLRIGVSTKTSPLDFAVDSVVVVSDRVAP